MITAEQKGFLMSIVDKLRQDDRIMGIAAGGSYIDGSMDEFSDLDLVIVAGERDYDTLFCDRFSLAESLGELLSVYTGEHIGIPDLLICFYGHPLLHVDMRFVTPEVAKNRTENPVILYQKENFMDHIYSNTPSASPQHGLQWMEDRFWVWIHYLAAKIGRGELFEAMDSLPFIRQRVLAPLLMKQNGKQAMGMRRLEASIPYGFDCLIPTLARYDAADCIRAVRETAALYRELRDASSESLTVPRDKAEAMAMEYLDIIAARIIK